MSVRNGDDRQQGARLGGRCTPRLQFLVDRDQFLVGGLQLFLGRLQFFVETLQLFVAGQRLLDRRSGFPPLLVVLLDHRKKPPARFRDFLFQLRDLTVRAGDGFLVIKWLFSRFDNVLFLVPLRRLHYNQ